jgi:hypothetical protein
VIHEIRIADGYEGRRLAPRQAQAIIEVLTWTAEHRRRTTEPDAASIDGRKGQAEICCAGGEPGATAGPLRIR